MTKADRLYWSKMCKLFLLQTNTCCSRSSFIERRKM